jgi:hypothetical protein
MIYADPFSSIGVDLMFRIKLIIQPLSSPLDHSILIFLYLFLKYSD